MPIAPISNPDDPLKDLRDVGKTKSLGYLPIETIKELIDVDSFIKELESAGRECLKVTSPVLGGEALFVYETSQLTALLEQHIEELKKASWPTDVKEFVMKVSTEAAGLESPVFDIITEAYGDDPKETRAEIQQRMWDETFREGKW